LGRRSRSPGRPDLDDEDVKTLTKRLKQPWASACR
jgi:hypothetical protein